MGKVRVAEVRRLRVRLGVLFFLFFYVCLLFIFIYSFFAYRRIRKVLTGVLARSPGSNRGFDVSFPPVFSALVSSLSHREKRDGVKRRPEIRLRLAGYSWKNFIDKKQTRMGEL